MNFHPSDTLPYLRERINAALPSALLPAVLASAAYRHYKRGYLSDCECEVCEHRREYVKRMMAGGGYLLNINFHHNQDEVWVSHRDTLREIEKGYKRKLLADFNRQVCSTAKT